MIDEQNAIRIRDDAFIACDALQSIIAAAPFIHENYLREKLKVVKGCIKFMEQFEDGDTE